MTYDPKTATINKLNEIGYKIFLDRYAVKDRRKGAIKVGNTVVVCTNLATSQREVGVVRHDRVEHGRAQVGLGDHLPPTLHAQLGAQGLALWRLRFSFVCHSAPPRPWTAAPNRSRMAALVQRLRCAAWILTAALCGQPPRSGVVSVPW